MSPELVIMVIGVVIVCLTFIVVALKLAMRRAPLKPNKKSYEKRWRDLQGYCKDKKTWPEAVLSADELVDRALKKRGFKGKSMGERLVSAQRKLEDNDAVWYAHKLAKKLRENHDMKLKEKEVKDALIGFRKALKDLGAL